LTGIVAGSLAQLSYLSAQDVVYPGSNAQGDILRGQGQFLKGMAWHEISAARSREFDSRTAIEQERWNREVYEAYSRQHVPTPQFPKPAAAEQGGP
jgi:hypothetical protein